MAERIIRDRRLTKEEAERYERIRDQIADELPEIRRRARAAKARILLKHVLKSAREERQGQGD